MIGLGATIAAVALFAASVITKRQPVVTIQPAPTHPDGTLTADEILHLVNVERNAKQLRVLKEDKRLTHIAQTRANDMVNRQYYAHLNPDGKYYYDLFPEYRIKAKYSCENLDVQFTVDEQTYIHDWLTSTRGHRECMLHKDVTSAGYAVIRFSKPSEYPVYIVVGIHTTPISTITPTL